MVTFLFNRSKCQSSFIYQSIKFWNNLPPEIKSSDSVNLFTNLFSLVAYKQLKFKYFIAIKYFIGMRWDAGCCHGPHDHVGLGYPHHHVDVGSTCPSHFIFLIDYILVRWLYFVHWLYLCRHWHFYICIHGPIMYRSIHTDFF